MIGKLQTNKEFAVQLFDYSLVDSETSKKIANEQKINKKIKIFLQVNIGNEDQNQVSIKKK